MESIDLQALGIQYEVVGASEPDAAFQRYLKDNHCKDLPHLRKTFGDQNAERPCLLHPQCASCRKKPQIDVAIFGTPCDPFSEQRNKRYADGSVCQRPLYEVTFTDAFNLLTDHQSPNATILEQVLGFNEAESRACEETPMDKPGAYPAGKLLVMVVTVIRLYGYTVRTL